MPRVVGCDPGTSSLDLLLMVEGQVADQARFQAGELSAADGPARVIERLRTWLPLDLIAGPSGYGAPLVRAGQMTRAIRDEMTLVRVDEAGTAVGVGGFGRLLDALSAASDLPVIFTPGGIHLPTVPRWRKAGVVDLGTADKVAVAALALAVNERERREGQTSPERFGVVEFGTAFTSILVLDRGRLVDAQAGTNGPIGLGSGGRWDGETAYLAGSLSKAHLFQGGWNDLVASGWNHEEATRALVESVVKAVAGLKAVTFMERLDLSGRGWDHAVVGEPLIQALERLAPVRHLPGLPGAWVKPAAQGAAILADGLAGGEFRSVVAALELRSCRGSVRDGLVSLEGQAFDAS